MKRLILLLTLTTALILSLSAQSWAWMGVTMVGGGGGAAAASGFIGSGTTGATSNPGTGANRAFFTEYTTTTAGTVSYAHLLIDAADQDENVCLCIWDNSGNIKTCTAATDVGIASGWWNVALASPTTISAATEYWLGFTHNDADNFTFVIGAYAVGPPEIYNDYNGVSCGGNVSAEGTYSNRPMAIIFDNQSGDPL